MGILDSFKRNGKPKKQYWGGDPDKLDVERDNTAIAIDEGQARSAQAATDLRGATNTSSAQFRDANARLGKVETQQGQLATQAGAGVDQALNDYRSGRGAILGNADKLEQSADQAEQNYKQTSDMQFRANQDANNRQALAMASRGGASGLRTALATNTTANANASAQAEITRAQEMNQIQSSREAALVNAANIRAGVGTQDQGVAGLQANRQQSATASQLAATGQVSQNIGTQGQIASNNAATLVGDARADVGQQIDYKTNMETAQLNSSREHEQQRLYRNSQQFNRWRDPLGVNGGS